MRKLWSYNAQAKAIEDSDNTLVMYSDDINDQVMADVVTLWNTNKELKDIQGWLDKSELCTTEEGDYVMEQIGVYQQQIPSEEVTATIVAEMKNIEKSKEVIQAAMVEELGKVIITDPPKKTRQPRAVPVVKNGNGKVLSSEDVIKQLKAQQEKTNKLISAIEWIDDSTVVTEEFPDGLHKEAIELLIKYGKDLAKLKSDYINQIQQL